MCRFLIETAHADVEILFIPQEEKFRAAIGEIGMANVNRRDERALPVVEFAVHLDRFLGLGNEADEWLVVGTGVDGLETQHEKRNDQQTPLPKRAHHGGTPLPTRNELHDRYCTVAFVVGLRNPKEGRIQKWVTLECGDSSPLFFARKHTLAARRIAVPKSGDESPHSKVTHQGVRRSS